MVDQFNELIADYTSKSERYFEGSRPEMLQFIPEGTSSLLDVGCGAGHFGKLAKESLPTCKVWGIEPSREAAALASGRLDRVLNGSFEPSNDGLSGQRFDCVVFNDVLEHLISPIDALSFARELLTPGGVVVASIPNILHFYQIGEILYQQDWRYREEGILDSTHLRFFTKKSILRMFEEAGFGKVKITGINPSTGARFWIANAIVMGRISDWKYVQFAVQAWEA